jgi:transposase-like protein
MPSTPPYPLEFRREAVRLLKTSGRSVPQLAKELGCSPQSLRNWARQLDVDEDRIPDVLMKLCAHVAAYEVVLKQWDEDDYTEHTAPIHFPGEELFAYVEERAARLKAEQNRLLRRTAPSR